MIMIMISMMIVVSIVLIIYFCPCHYIALDFLARFMWHCFACIAVS